LTFAEIERASLLNRSKFKEERLLMRDEHSLRHARWECKYHIVWIPKYRRKKLFAELRARLGEVFHELARQKESRIEEGLLLVDHVHMLISIPPKLAVSSVVGFIKGKSAIHIARNFMGKRRNFVGESFWARGYYVSTVGLDEEIVRAYIKTQEDEDKRVDQLQLW
jgi:putative transposase